MEVFYTKRNKITRKAVMRKMIAALIEEIWKGNSMKNLYTTGIHMRIRNQTTPRVKAYWGVLQLQLKTSY